MILLFKLYSGPKQQLANKKTKTAKRIKLIIMPLFKLVEQTVPQICPIIIFVGFAMVNITLQLSAVLKNAAE